jgi:small-conductance mechanosensitive channel
MREQLQQLFTPLSELGSIELRVLESVAVIAFIVALRWALVVIVRRNTTEARTRYHWRKGITYTLVAIGLFIVARIWFVGFRSIGTFLGLVAAGLVLALKEPLLNIAGWLLLISRRPFAVGDRIQIGEWTGDVIDLQLFEFALLEVGNWVASDQSTGRVVHVPNARIFEEPVANYTRGFPYIWDELAVNLSFESNWRAAKEQLLGIVQRHGHPVAEADAERILADSRRYLIFYSTLAPIVYTSVNERGILLAARYICDVRRRRDTAQAIWEDVLTAFAAAADIDFAYPTQRFFDRAAEGRALGGDTSRASGARDDDSPASR